MDGLTLKVFVLGPLATNAYLIFDKKRKKGFVVDTPSPAEKLKEFIIKEDLDILFVALTHGHFDHIGGLDDFCKLVYVHPKDAALLKDARLNGSLFFGSPYVYERRVYFYEGDNLHFGDYSLDIIHTPGHTPGSVAIKIGSWLFSGDTIFFDSIGRTDIPLASHNLLIKSIKERLLTLPPDTVVYPGHGISTTIERECKSNPFLI
jgi:glyoxylase-like metal-dependent hydrolase (beta-lactamase superfamily II)